MFTDSVTTGCPSRLESSFALDCLVSDRPGAAKWNLIFDAWLRCKFKNYLYWKSIHRFDDYSYGSESVETAINRFLFLILDL